MNATDTATYTAKGLLGRTEDGNRVWVKIEIREVNQPSETVEHAKVESYRELSISGAVAQKGCRNADSWGQVRGDAAGAMAAPAKGLTEDDIAHLVTVWKRYHLNGMQAGCAHQTIVWETGPYGERRPSLALTPICPVQDADENVKKPYRYGSAWLVKELPTEVEEWVRALGDKLDGTEAKG
jgi:hypothetical protein